MWRFHLLLLLILNILAIKEKLTPIYWKLATVLWFLDITYMLDQRYEALYPKEISSHFILLTTTQLLSLLQIVEIDNLHLCAYNCIAYCRLDDFGVFTFI